MTPTLASRTLSLIAVSLLLAVSGCSDGPTVPGDNNPPDDNGTPYDHAQAAGASANDLLAGDTFDRLVVQVQYVGSFAPTAQGLQHLEDFLNARLNKPGGVQILTPEQIPVTPQATYSVADIRAIEDQHRTQYTEDGTIVAWFLWVDGEFDQASNVLGIAYNNTSMAIFAEKIDQNTGGIGQPSTSLVEGTVAIHEFGHILGLVNNGSTMQVEHQDEPNGRHCDDPDCLMYYAVRTTDFLSNLVGAGLPTLDQNCLDDLAANGGK